MTPSQRTILSALALGALGFLVLFALGVTWPVAGGLALLLAGSVGMALNYLTPSDKDRELEDNLRRIDTAAVRIQSLSQRVSDAGTQAALVTGCGGVPSMIENIQQRDVRVALPLAQRSLAYLTDVASTLEDYIDVQNNGEAEYIRLGQEELKRLAAFTSQPDKSLTAQKMDDYINSLTALNLNPPPEFT